MAHPIIDKIVQQGVHSVNISMLSHDARFKLMTEAGNVLMHMSRFKEAGEAYAVGENKDLLREQGHWFYKQKKFGMAAYFLVHVEKEEVLQTLAQECIAAGDIDAARGIYEKLGDQIMLAFLKENFTLPESH